MIALVIGHRESSQGASGGDVTEWRYNSGLAALVLSELRAEGISSTIVERLDRRSGYSELPSILNEIEPTLILSLHLNASAHESASGACALYWHRSSIGKRLASRLSAEVAAALDLRDRGAISRREGDRGAPLLQRSVAPCVIVEPAFVSNDDDRAKLLSMQGALATAYATALADVYREQRDG